MPLHNHVDAENAQSSYLRAASTPQLRVKGLTPLPAPFAANSSPQAPNIVLTRQALNRVSRVAAKFVGHEDHFAVKITSSLPMRGPRFFRLALREVGMVESIVIVATDSPMVLFAVARPAHIGLIEPQCARYCKLVHNSFRICAPSHTLRGTQSRTLHQTLTNCCESTDTTSPKSFAYPVCATNSQQQLTLLTLYGRFSTVSE